MRSLLGVMNAELLLAAIPLFNGLGGPELAEAARAARCRTFGRGEILFGQGAEANAFYVLLEGRVRVTQVTPEGEQVLVRFVGPGEMMGCVAVFGEACYPGTAEAVVPCKTLCWDGPTTANLMERFPRIALNALSSTNRRLQEAQARYRDLATLRVERRVGRALLRLVRQAGKRTPDGIEIAFPLSRQDLAELTGTTLYSVSRILSDWEERGIVTGSRQRVVVRDPHRLVAIAEDLAEPDR